MRDSTHDNKHFYFILGFIAYLLNFYSFSYESRKRNYKFEKKKCFIIGISITKLNIEFSKAFSVMRPNMMLMKNEE